MSLQVYDQDASTPDESRYVEFSRTALTFAADTPYEVWHEVTQRLLEANQSIQFWIGDAVAFGEARYGDEAFQALPVEKGTVDNWASVARRVPVSRRRETLKFSYHEAVASLPPDDQEHWLEEADSGDAEHPRLRYRELRDKIRDAENGPAEVMQTKPCEACNGAGRVPVEDGE